MDQTMQFPPEYLKEDNSQQLLDVAIVFGVLNTLFILLFFTARIMNKTANGLEMYLMPLAYIFCFSHSIVIPLHIRHGGAGKHVQVVTPQELRVWLKLVFVEEIIYVFAVSMSKLAILCLYLRIFTTRPYRRACYGIAVVIILSFLAGIILSLSMCRPIAYRWDKAIPGGSCGDIMTAYRWISFPNLITDVAMLILPLPVIWGLQMGRNQKIGLTLTFLTGSFGIITSILRFVNFFQTNLFSDPTFLVVQTMTWTCVEPSVYLIAATMPSLQPLVRLIFRKTHFRSRMIGNRGIKKRLTDNKRDSPMLPVKETSSGVEFTKVGKTNVNVMPA
ncbi:MAG: hypothetical protein M1816_006575 [Peltula sp. TS41687]|nr:MAG: hypothetical protein M1816_006575 [Peltula sp. TS41687]